MFLGHIDNHCMCQPNLKLISLKFSSKFEGFDILLKIKCHIKTLALNIWLCLNYERYSSIILPKYK